MDAIRSVVAELHRRSIWQVLALYLAGSWVALQVVDQIAEITGLPDWVPAFCLILLVIGLPIVIATAFIQEGLPGGGEPALAEASRALAGAEPGTPKSAGRRLLTWRNAVVGGAAAFALLGVVVALYFAMRALGLGGVGALVAKGAVTPGEPVVLADFENGTTDASVGNLVTEALRMDLVESTVLELATSARVQQVLERMDRANDTVLTPDLAREVAQRAGLKAVIRGEVSPAGEGYVLTASVVGAETGEELAGFRERAASADELVDAIDKLSERIRYRVGESLPAIRAGEPLQDVTTSSLEALRKYTEALKLSDRGQLRPAIALLEEATQLDTAFAMAYRKLAVAMNNLGDYPPRRRRELIAKAYEHRDRLSEVERYQTVAYYHYGVTEDYDAAITAYQNVLRLNAHDGTALNNLAIAYQRLDRYEDAAPLLETAVDAAPSAVAHGNLIQNYLLMLDTASAVQAMERFEREYPEHPSTVFIRYDVESHRGNAAGAHEAAQRGASLESTSLGRRAAAMADPERIDRAQGRWREARQHLRDAAQFAEMNGGPATALFYRLRETQGLLWTVRDSAGARTMLRTLVAGPFEQLPPMSRPWNFVLGMMTELEMFDEGRTLLRRWETEVPESDRPPGFDIDFRRHSRDMELGLAGDPDAIAQAFRQAQVDERCTRCYRWPLAEAEAKRGNFAIAAELYRNSIDQPISVSVHPMNRVIALERMAELYDLAGDHANAASAYLAFAEAWKDADPELQPRVQAARDRATTLLAGRVNRLP